MSESVSSMGSKVAVDLSRFVLLEAAGDSDAAFDASGGDDGRGRGEDDAESCSYDAGYKGFRGTGIVKEDMRFDCDGDEKGGGDCGGVMAMAGEEEEEGVSEVASTANSYGVRRCERPAKRRKMSEVEKSRLFWEACLAS